MVMTVPFEEWLETIYKIENKDPLLKDFDVMAYVIINQEEESAIIIDCPSKAHVKDTFDLLKEYKLKPNAIQHVLLTHVHPYSCGGLKHLYKKINPSLHVQSEAREFFEKGKKYLLEDVYGLNRTGAKISLAFKTRIFGEFDKLPNIEEVQFFEKELTLKWGSDMLFGQHLGAHSADSTMYHLVKKKVTFVGDEISFIADNPHAYYFDQRGSVENRLRTIKILSQVKTQWLLPLHGVPLDQATRGGFFTNAEFTLEHLERTTMDALIAIGEAKTPYIAEQVYSFLEFEWPESLKDINADILTIEAVLKKLKNEGRVSFDEKTKRWKPR